MEKITSVTFICPKTNQTTSAQSDDFDIDGWCASDEFPAEHEIIVYCKICKNYHLVKD